MNHTQYQTVRNVMGYQTAPLPDGPKITLLKMKTNTCVMTLRVSYLTMLDKVGGTNGGLSRGAVSSFVNFSI